ncbi:site-specific integrase [Vibrio sp. SA48]|uniref:site-specific integrase n=1 Tax=Vibrio sp. S12_S33 TaxID=2720223 RepID=UPI00177D3B1B|nr:site-specific integrase [Vibrio sp. S12_S33]MBD1564298.1 site-specific integrase [Vibrio sp. S12_S33]
MTVKQPLSNLEVISEWVETVIKDIDFLWCIPVYSTKLNHYGMGINKSWLEKQVPVHRKAAERNPLIQAQLDRVIQAMIDADILIEGESSGANEARRLLLSEYNQLSKSEKASLRLKEGMPLFSKVVKSHSYRKFRSSKAIQLAFKQIRRDYRSIVRKNYSGTQRNKTERQVAEDYRKPIRKWVKRVSRKSTLLWKIPVVTKKVNKDGCNHYAVSAEWARNAFGITVATYNTLKYEINAVIPLMIEAGIVYIDEPAGATNARRELFLWFDGLTQNQLREIPIYNNKVSRAYLSEICTGYSIYKQSLAVSDVLKKIHNELCSKGIVEPDEVFLSYSQRRELQDKEFRIKRDEKSQYWLFLSNLTLSSIDDFLEPTDDEPFVQIQQLFARCLKESKSKSAKDSLKDAYYKYSSYLMSYRGSENLYIADFFNEYTVINYKAYLQQLVVDKKISPSYSNGLLSCLRKALDKTKHINQLKLEPFLDAQGFDSKRVTDRYRPFTEFERRCISDAIHSELNERRELLKPYQESVDGHDPLDSNNRVNWSLLNENNVKWLFENKLNQKIVNTRTEAPLEIAFIKSMSKLGRLHEVYARFGVNSLTNMDFILPYILRLAQVTGLNLESLIELQLDDYLEEHNITGKPCLRYWKERSTGEKEYQLDLVDLFDAKLTWLTIKQSSEVRKIFSEIKVLTKRIRDSAPDEVKGYLFIYERVSGGDVYRVRFNSIYQSLQTFSEKHNLRDSNNEAIQLNVARFRPTFVSEMIELGASIRDIQVLLGHSTIITTISYLDKLDFNKLARNKVKLKLELVHENALSNCKNHQDGNEKVEKGSDFNGNVVFKTPLAACKNIFNPPDFIKKSKNYVAGTPCGNYNRCLGCDNIMISKVHLPELFAMQRDYTELNQRSRLSDTPYGQVIQENLFLLDEILNPGKSEFSKNDLEQAEKLSMHIDTSVVVDGVSA